MLLNNKIKGLFWLLSFMVYIFFIASLFIALQPSPHIVSVGDNIVPPESKTFCVSSFNGLLLVMIVLSISLHIILYVLSSIVYG